MKLIFIVCLLIVSSSVFAQNKYNLWENEEMPYAKKNSLKEYEKELWGTTCVLNVTQPVLTVYQAKGTNSGKAVIILPGGGYTVEAIYHEGYDVAKALSKQGITAAVLKYRLPNIEASDNPELLPITDTQRALQLLRSMSGKYGFEKDQIGVMGFSAGGHLAALVSSKEKERPNFSLIIYGCPRLTDENIKWLETDLFHRKMTKEDFYEYNLIDNTSL